MKHARIAWAGAIHDAIESDGQLELRTPAFRGRRGWHSTRWSGCRPWRRRTAHAPSWRWD